MPGSPTTPGWPSARVGALGHIAFHYTDSVGTRDQFSIAAQWLACTFPCRRFADILADACARLGPMWVATPSSQWTCTTYSLPVSRRTCVQTVGSHLPWTGTASSSPGHGGIVAPIATRGSTPSQRNWKCVPVGMLIEMPGHTSTTSSSSPSFRHMRPFPEVKYQISSIMRWVTAFETAFGDNANAASPPRESWHSTRTSDPSGAMTSGSALTRLVSKRIVTSAGTDDRLSCDTLVLCSEIWVRDRGRSLMEEDSAHAHTSYFRGQTHQTNAPNRGRVAADMI